jgi:hypothetical protein
MSCICGHATSQHKYGDSWCLEETCGCTMYTREDDGGRTAIGNTPTCEHCGEPQDHRSRAPEHGL